MGLNCWEEIGSDLMIIGPGVGVVLEFIIGSSGGISEEVAELPGVWGKEGKVGGRGWVKSIGNWEFPHAPQGEGGNGAGYGLNGLNIEFGCCCWGVGGAGV